MEKIFIETNGKRRIGIEVVCAECDIKFITRAMRPYKCCSKECSYKWREKKEIVNCAKCKNKFAITPSKKKNSKSGLYFCSRKCKDEAQRIGGIREIMPPHYGIGKSQKVYRGFFKNEELVCKRCGYNEFIECVDIHHIDENKENNNRNNLVPLCACCHRALYSKLWSFEGLLV